MEMLHCPKCGYEYEKGTDRCADCDGPLEPGPLPEARRKELDREPLVPVATPEDEFEGRLLADVLSGNGIPATVSSREMPWYDGLASHVMNAGTWGTVLVRRRDAARARQLIDDYVRTSQPAEPAGETTC